MYIALILQHIKLKIDVTILRLYQRLLVNIQKICIKISDSLLKFATKANDKSTDAIQAYSDAMTAEIEFRYAVRELTLPAPRFQNNKL